MTRFPLDADTADRLLTGSVAPEDAPHGYAEVARQFHAVTRRPASARRAGTEQAAVAALVEGIRGTQPVTPVARRKSVFTKAKLAAAGLAGALSLTTGLAAANALPGAAQQAASDALAKVGVSVPSPNSHSAGHADTRGKSAAHNGDSSATSGNGPNAHADFGLCTAENANAGHPNAHADVFPSATTCSTVVHPGQPANPGSDNQANPENPGSKPATTPASGSAVVDTPNGGGTSTANTASDGPSSAGTGTADQHSGGASSNGSDNASSHKP